MKCTRLLSMVPALIILAAAFLPTANARGLTDVSARSTGTEQTAIGSGLPEGTSEVAPAEQEEGAYRVTWSVTATGNFDGLLAGSTQVRAQLSESHRAEGVAVVRPDMSFPYSTNPHFIGTATSFQETHNWNYAQILTFSCDDPPGTYRSVLRQWITDPDRHTGVGPNPGLRNPSQVNSFPLPQQRPDGTWFMEEPYEITTARGHNRKVVSRTVHCTGDTHGWGNEGFGGTGPSFRPQILEGDARGVAFSMTHNYRTGGSDASNQLMLDVVRQVTVTRLPGKASLTQEAELDERSIFLPTIPLTNRMDGLLDCRDLVGCLVKREIQLPGAAPAVESIGPTQDKTIPRVIDIGSLPPGRTRITAQATDSTGSDSSSAPDTKQIQVADKLPAWLERLATVSGQKIGNLGVYSGDLKYPDPAAKGKVTVPSFVPFFGGSPLGVEDTQAQVKIEVPSVGAGKLEGGGQTGFSAAGSTILGGVTFRMKAKIEEAGLTTSDGEFKFKLGGKIKKEESLLKVIPPLAPVVQTIESFSSRAAAVLRERAKAKLELEPQFNFLLRVVEDAFGDLTFEDGGVEPAIGVKITASIELVKDILKVTAGAGGEVAARFESPPFELKKVQLKLQAFAEIVLFRYKGSAAKAHTWFYPGGGASATSIDGASTAGPIWTPLDRSYLAAPDYARWTAPSIASAGIESRATDTELVANVYPQAQPALALGGSKRLLVWSHDRPDAPADAGGEIAFSTSPGTGRPWTTGVQVTNDDRDDYSRHVVFVPGGSAVAVWEKFDSPTPGDPNADPRGYLSHVQVAASRWNGTTWSTPQQLSTSGSFNSRPQLGATSTGALAVWIGNAGNQIVGDTAQPDTIYFSQYTTSTNSWSAPVAVLSNLAGLLELRLAASGSNAALVYAQDLDGNPATDADQELFSIQRSGTNWDAPVRLTNNSTLDDSPQLVLTSTGTPQLVWRQGSGFKFLNGSWDTAVAIDLALPDAVESSDLRLVRATDGNLALTWQQPTALDTRIGYSIYDATNGLWGTGQTLSPPVTSTVTGTSTLATNITSVLEANRLLVAYQLATVEATTVTLGDGTTVPNVPRIGSHSLRYSELPLGRNLSIAPAEMSAHPTEAAASDPVTVTAVVRNTGQLAVPKFQVDLRDDVRSATILTRTVEPLAAGAAVTVTFPLTQTAAVSDVAVVIDSRGIVRETNEDDNKATIGTNLQVTPLAPLSGPAGTEVRARIEQRGAIHGGHLVTASLRLHGPDGPELMQTAAGFPEGFGQDVVTATAVITPGQIGAGRHTLYWLVGPSGRWADPDDENNGSVSELAVLPDLAAQPELIDFGNAPGATAPVSLRIVNQGNWASGGGRVAFFDRDPGQSGAIALGSISLPNVAAGEVITLTGTLDLSATPSRETGLSSLWVQIDPDGAVDELNENNNLSAAGRVIGHTPGSQPASFRIFLPTIHRQTAGW